MKKVQVISGILFVISMALFVSGYAQFSKKQDSIPRPVNDTLNSSSKKMLPAEIKQDSDAWLNTLPLNLTIEIIGGALCFLLGSGLTLFFNYSKRKVQKRRFKQIFGEELSDFNIIYPSLTLEPVYDQQGNPMTYPYKKDNANYKMKAPVPLSDIKAALYIAETFVKESSKNPSMRSDQSVMTKMDLSFCAVGGLLNYKTKQVLNNSANKFYKISTQTYVSIVRVSDGKDFNNSHKFDLGIIIKITHPNFPNRKQFCIAGLGETGTSAAAWYLAKNWRKLRKKVKGNDFGALINADIGIDESATLFDLQIAQ